MAEPAWPEQLENNLRFYWKLGLSTALIGGKLGKSKNSIVGKAHRLDLDPRPSPIRRDPTKPPPRPTVLTVHPSATTLPVLASIANIPEVEPSITRTAMPIRLQCEARMPDAPIRRRDGTGCQFPIGEPGRPGFRMCDDNLVSRLKPYCEQHTNLTRAKIQPGRRGADA